MSVPAPVESNKESTTAASGDQKVSIMELYEERHEAFHKEILAAQGPPERGRTVELSSSPR